MAKVIFFRIRINLDNIMSLTLEMSGVKLYMFLS